MIPLVIKYVPRGEGKRPLTVVVSTKVSKRATERNRIKRQIKEIMRSRIKKDIHDYTIIIRPAARGLSYSELSRCVETAVKGR